MTHENYYEILGVDRSATRKEIQKVFHSLARKYHPDVNPAPRVVERFKQISAAYEVLSDPEQRARYDLQLGADRGRPRQTRGDPGDTGWHRQTSYNRWTGGEWHYSRQRASASLFPDGLLSAMVLARTARIGVLILAVYLLIRLIADTIGPDLDWEGYFIASALLGSLASFGWGLYLRGQSKCPRCCRPWGREDVRKNRVDVFYKDVFLDGLPPIPHERYRVHHRCKYCGHRWISTQVRPWMHFV